MDFELLGTIREVEVIAVGPGIRERPRLNRAYGRGRWRKPKGVAAVRWPNGRVRTVEVHW